jgi:hypothetical protein
MPDERAKPAMMRALGPGASRGLAFEPLRVATPPPLLERRRVTLFTDLTPSLRSIRCLSWAPRADSPPFGIDGVGLHTLLAALAVVLVLARSDGVLRAR